MLCDDVGRMMCYVIRVMMCDVIMMIYDGIRNNIQDMNQKKGEKKSLCLKRYSYL